MKKDMYNMIPAEIRSYCPVCDAKNVRWQPLPGQYMQKSRQYGYKHFGSGEMTPLFTYLCPVCGASDRERFYAQFLHELKETQEDAPKHMIHFAPESALSRHIRKEQYFASYQTADMSMAGVDFHIDIQSLPFENDSYDFFICSHVLEHVPDDRKALQELYRILRPGGFGILMAPICLGIEKTIEDSSITDGEIRWKLFGQDDHLRLYSHDDYVKRIEESGFLLQQLTSKDFGENVFHQLGLKLSSVLYVVGKPLEHYTEKTFLPPREINLPSISNKFSVDDEMVIPKVSVILTSWNHEKYLHEAIQSALSQTYRNFELIIWDDASTDDSWSIIKQYKDKRIRAFRSDVRCRGGVHINKTISEIAKGKYIAIHHSDDVWELEKIEKQVDFLDRHPDTGAVFSWVNIIDDNSNINNSAFLHGIFRQNNKTRYEWLRYFFYVGNALCHPSVLIRKKCYNDCGAYNMALWQLTDFDMWVRLCFKYEIHILPEYLVKFRWKSDGSNTSDLNAQTVCRREFEHFMLLNHYCQITSVEEFLKIFPSSKKYCGHPDADIEFALSMTAIELNSSAKHRLFGLQLLYKLMASPERAEKIRSVHGFTNMDFADITKQMQIFTTSQPQSFPVSKTLTSPLEQGIQAYNQDDHETAINCLSAAMTQEPNNPLPYAYLAFICARQGLTSEARNFIAHSTRLTPERADFVAALGEVFLKNGRPSEALEYLREAVNMQPGYMPARAALAELELQLNNFDAARKITLGAIDVAPNYPALYNLLVKIELNRNNHRQAAEDAILGLQKCPNGGEGLWHHLAAVYLAQNGEPNTARAILEMGLKAFPDDSHLMRLKGMI